MIKIDPSIITRQNRLRAERYERDKENKKRRIRERRLKDPQFYLWDKAKRRAKKEGLRFNIEPEDIVIPSFCPILGISIRVLSPDRYSSATLDKVIPDRGYVKGNIAVISRRANEIKGYASLQELYLVARWLESVSPDTDD